MKVLIMILISIFISSCASQQSKKVAALEDKINKLTELLEKNQNKVEQKNENPTEMKQDKKEVTIVESPDIDITIPKVSQEKNKSKTSKMYLGKKDNIEFNLFFNKNTYWLVLSPLNNKADTSGQVVLNINHNNKSPESLSFFSIKEGIYKSFGEPLTGFVDLEIKFHRENKKTIVFKVEAQI